MSLLENSSIEEIAVFGSYPSSCSFRILGLYQFGGSGGNGIFA